MRILILSFAIFAKGINLTARDFAIFDEKLRGYQNMTGIDDAIFNEIWEAGITNGKVIYRQVSIYFHFFQFKIICSRQKTIRKVLQLDMDHLSW